MKIDLIICTLTVLWVACKFPGIIKVILDGNKKQSKTLFEFVFSFLLKLTLCYFLVIKTKIKMSKSVFKLLLCILTFLLRNYRGTYRRIYDSTTVPKITMPNFILIVFFLLIGIIWTEKIPRKITWRKYEISPTRNGVIETKTKSYWRSWERSKQFFS